MVDDAAVDDPFACKIETSASFASNTAFVGQLTPACVLPLFRPTEVGVNVVRGRTQDGDWRSGLLAKAKMNLLPVETGKVGLALSGGPAFNLLTGEFAGGSFNVPVTYTVSDSFKVNVNVGWIYERENERHFAAYGAGVEWIPAKPFTLIAEVLRGLDIKSGNAHGSRPALSGWRPHHADRDNGLRPDLRPQHFGRERPLDDAWLEHTLPAAEELTRLHPGSDCAARRSPRSRSRRHRPASSTPDWACARARRRTACR